MHPKVALFLMAFGSCTSIVLSAILPVNHGSNYTDSKEFSQPIVLRRSARAPPYSNSSRGFSQVINYYIVDNQGNAHYHEEEADGSGNARGSYGYSDITGLFRRVEYTADKNGFRANIKSNEPTLLGKKISPDLRLNYEESDSEVRDRLYSDVDANGNENSGELERNPEGIPYIPEIQRTMGALKNNGYKSGNQNNADSVDYPEW